MGAVQSGAIYQFKVALIGITPLIWRRFQVTGDYTLAQLHRVLQAIMGWENYHLYMFRIGRKKYGPLDPDGLVDLGMVDAKRIRLAAVVPSVGITFTYVYDYGDSSRRSQAQMRRKSRRPEQALPFLAEFFGHKMDTNAEHL